MQKVFSIDDALTFTRKVSEHDTATFESGTVHRVYATFALARDAEWTCRQFVLKMKENNEEGIGTFIEVNHVSPALVGENVVFTGILKAINHHEIICSFEAKVNNRLIAHGKTGQKILLLEKLQQVFDKIE